jgi:membrane-bound inhibitor of C-type lysozyme
MKSNRPRWPQLKLDFVDRCRSLQARVAVGHPDRMPAASPEREVQARGCAAIAVLALLAACALERAPRVVRVTYDCDQGNGFVARYERDGQVIVELGDREWVLPEVSAIAGIRYDDGTHELRLNGRNATLRGTAPTYSNCVARDWKESAPR